MQNPEIISFREVFPNIKKTNYLTHGVYYYPAKFIPHVVKFCLETYTKPNEWIIDPFAGSGTVGLEAYLNNRNVILYDINFMLNHIMPLKIPNLRFELNSNILIDKIESIINNSTLYEPQWKTIDYWYPAEMLIVIKKLWGGLKKIEKDIYFELIQSSLIRISKEFSYAEHKTPKLFRSKQKKVKIDEILNVDWCYELYSKLKKYSLDSMKSINDVVGLSANINSIVKYYGGIDSATTNMDLNIDVDCVITSPPYLQAQEYIRTSKLDLYWLGYSEEQVKSISDLEIPYRKTEIVLSTTTLDKIRMQLKSTKLIAILNSYFYYTISAIENASHSLKKGGHLCVFVGNPKIDGIEVETWKILNEYFETRGYDFKIVYEDRIKNRQLFKSRNNKNPDGMKSEYLLVLVKS
jgi:DNA modification methylase